MNQQKKGKSVITFKVLRTKGSWIQKKGVKGA